MSSVWEATDELLGRKVAVKILTLDEDAAPGVTERFRREARLAASVNHPNIVTVFDTGVDGSTAFLVMELLSGPTLAQKLVQSGPLRVREAMEVAEQVCAALAGAHAAGVVHRDIKPSNIAYASDRSVKVLDFGIARLLEATTGQTELTRTATVIGTAAYLSPEQAGGDPVSARTDLYALGCVLFAMLAGDPPFRGDTAVAVCSQHLHVEAPRLADRRPSVPPALDALVAELLRKDPATRPLDAESVRHRLLAIRDAPPAEDPTVRLVVPDVAATAVYPQPVPAVPVPAAAVMAAPVPSEPEQRHRVRAAVAVVVLAAGVVTALLVGRSSPHRHTTLPPASSSRVTSTSSSTTTTTSTTTTIAIATTPAQAITQLRAAIANVESNGQLEGPAGTDLVRRLSEVSKALTKSHGNSAGHEVADLASQIAQLVRSGQLTPAGQAVLAQPLAALERLVPPDTGPGGPPGPPGGTAPQPGKPGGSANSSAG
jgi:serine/threonine protein kinase